MGAIAMLAMFGAGCANSSAATCDPACPDFYACCEGGAGASCRDVLNESTNCGGCGIVCPSGMCRMGSCVPGTMTDGGTTPGTDSGMRGMCGLSCDETTSRCCGTTCLSRSGVAAGADGRTDPTFSNCNGCGIACDPERASACSVAGGGTGMPTCMCGVYNACSSGSVCVSQSGSFACVNTQTDINNCGAIGNACAMGESCMSGVCQCGSTGAACTAGQACCGGACIDSQTDAMNCGGCGVACAGDESCQA
ncbi:MAG: hypothetical protein M3Y87_20040, partial [Myxococcota bacterium]|nr:hypothetical protein [Myxococcota bacterium]